MSTRPEDDALTPEERAELLRVARRSLEEHFAGRGPFRPKPKSPTLRQRRGAFVTLHRAQEGDLRGCVGMMRAEESLARTVARMAVAAGTEDGRFDWDWRVIDIYSNGNVSELALRRSEFANRFKQEGIDKLIASVDKQASKR